MESRQEPETRAAALKSRTKQFAVAAIRLCRLFPRSVDGFVVAKQLTKSATATAANYRAACRARSAIEFAARIGVVAEEADESEFWLELTIEADVLQGRNRCSHCVGRPESWRQSLLPHGTLRRETCDGRSGDTGSIGNASNPANVGNGECGQFSPAGTTTAPSKRRASAVCSANLGRVRLEGPCPG